MDFAREAERLKCQWLVIGLLIGLLFSGCTKGQEETQAIEQIASLNSESKELRAQLEQLQEQLRKSETNAVAWKEKSEANPATLSVMDQYPKLAFLANSPVIEKIEIKDEQGTSLITDKNILSHLSHAFALQHIVQPGSPPVPDVEPAELILTTDQGTVNVQLVQRNVVQFDELYPGEYFAVDTAIYQLAKAVMNRPQYIPDNQPTIMKMIDSGLMRADENVYMTHPGRILYIAKIFFQLEKKSIAKPANLSPLELTLTFYYYSKEIELYLYRNHARLVDGDQESWFEIEEGAGELVISHLNAG